MCPGCVALRCAVGARPSLTFSLPLPHPRPRRQQPQQGEEENTADEDVTTAVTLSVLQNGYDGTKFELRGTVAVADVVVDVNGDVGSDDKVDFGELDLSRDADTGASVPLVLRNMTVHTVRYAFEASDGRISTLPSAGHLPPGGSARAVARFRTAEAATLADAPLTLTTQRVALVADEAAGELDEYGMQASATAAAWNAEATVRRPCNAEEAAAGAGPMVTAPLPEPRWEAAPAAPPPQAQALLCQAVADTSACVLVDNEASALHFDTTSMYLARTAPFKVENTSDIGVPYDWDVDSAAFRIAPRFGVLPPHAVTPFAAVFAPEDAGAHAGSARIASGSFAIDVALSGAATRPVCHFQVDEDEECVEMRAVGVGCCALWLVLVVVVVLLLLLLLLYYSYCH